MAESFDIRQANGQGPLGKEPTSPQLISARTRVTAEILAHTSPASALLSLQGCLGGAMDLRSKVTEPGYR